MFELELQPFLLCYFPMFMVILGFIAYAVITDANARRTYLRRTDMRPELEQLAMPGGAPAVNSPEMAQTPTGLMFRRSGESASVDGVPLVGEVHHGGGSASVDVSAESTLDTLAMNEPEPDPAPVAAPVAAPTETGKPDDLRKIEGIGPKMKSVLNAGGIKTFAQLAAQSPDAVRAILKADGVNINANNPETWPEQAALAAAGDWDGLEKLQNQLVGGRRR